LNECAYRASSESGDVRRDDTFVFADDPWRGKGDLTGYLTSVVDAYGGNPAGTEAIRTQLFNEDECDDDCWYTARDARIEVKQRMQGSRVFDAAEQARAVWCRPALRAPD